MTTAQFFWGIVTWLTVIVGWMVVADQQNYRELRKDRAARLNDIRAALLKIEEDAVSFHTAPEFSMASAFALRRGIGTLSRELTMLGDCKFIESSWSGLMIALRQSCTQTSQDERSFKQVDHFSARVGDIMVAREDLDDLLVAALTQALLGHKPIQSSLGDLWTALRARLAAVGTVIRERCSRLDNDPDVQ